MTERKYKDEEVREILALATRQGATANPASHTAQGLTLAEIQSIGLEVGVDPQAVAQAAAALESRPQKSRRVVLGVPVGVGRTVQLPRALTDHEWEQLVAELRATFNARGQVSGSGGLREWRNGNLFAAIEPNERGYRLRLGTRKGDAAGITAIGVIGTGAGFLSVASIVTGQLGALGADALIGPALLMTAGVGTLLSNFVRLPRWAHSREAEFDRIAAKVQAMTQATPRETK